VEILSESLCVGLLPFQYESANQVGLLPDRAVIRFILRHHCSYRGEHLCVLLRISRGRRDLWALNILVTLEVLLVIWEGDVSI